MQAMNARLEVLPILAQYFLIFFTVCILGKFGNEYILKQSDYLLLCLVSTNQIHAFIIEYGGHI